MGLKVVPLLILLAWALCAPGVQAAEDGGITGPLGFHAYLEDGIHYEGPKKNLRFKINGRAYLDWGENFANEELQEAFPGLEGRHTELRTLQLSLHGWFKKDLEFEGLSDEEIEEALDETVGCGIDADEWLGNGTTYRVIEIWGAP